MRSHLGVEGTVSQLLPCRGLQLFLGLVHAQVARLHQDSQNPHESVVAGEKKHLLLFALSFLQHNESVFDISKTSYTWSPKDTCILSRMCCMKLLFIGIKQCYAESFAFNSMQPLTLPSSC